MKPLSAKAIFIIGSFAVFPGACTASEKLLPVEASHDFEITARRLVTLFEQVCYNTESDKQQISELAKKLGWTERTPYQNEKISTSGWAIAAESEGSYEVLIYSEPGGMTDGLFAHPNCTIALWSTNPSTQTLVAEIKMLRAALLSALFIETIDSTDLDIDEWSKPELLIPIYWKEFTVITPADFSYMWGRLDGAYVIAMVTEGSNVVE